MHDTRISLVDSWNTTGRVDPLLPLIDTEIHVQTLRIFFPADKTMTIRT